MPTTIQAAVTSSAEAPLVLEELILDDPAAGELLVKVEASGICHTDFLGPHAVSLPAVFGHEGIGRVIAVGSGVEGLLPGDRVVGSFGSCGHCGKCQAGETFHCDDFSTIQLGARRAGNPSLRRADGTPVTGAFFEQSSFASHALMTQGNVVKVNADVPAEYLAPLGCGVLTGFGAVSQALQPAAGQSLLVLGAGGVGLSAIMAARLAGCDPIIAVDVLPSRLELASEFGATHGLDGQQADLLQQIHTLTGEGVDFSLETVAHEDTFNLAIQATRPGGTCGFVAIPNLGQAFQITSGRPLLKLNLLGIIEGRCRPQDAIPKLVQLIENGELPMAQYTTVFDFADINAAMQAALSGEVAKPVLRMA